MREGATCFLRRYGRWITDSVSEMEVLDSAGTNWEEYDFTRNDCIFL